MHKPIFFKSLVLLFLLSFQIFAYAVESVSSLPACKDNVCRLIDAGSDAQSAIEQLKTLYAADANLPKSLLDVASRYQIQKQYDQSTALYKSISAAYADKDIASRCRVQLSKIDILKMITAGSIAAAEQAVVRFETDFAGSKYLPACLRNIAVRYEECGSAGQAKALYTRIIERYASDAVNSRNAALQLAKLGIYDLIEKKDFSGADAAIRKLETDFTGYKELPNRLCDIAEKYEKSGGVEDAKALYGKVVKQYASDAVESRNAAMQLGKLDIYGFIEKKDFSSAQAAAKRMEVDFAGHKRLAIRLYQTACRYERFGGTEQARALYTQITERYAADADVSKNASLQLAKLNVCDLIAKEDFSSAQAAVKKIETDFAGRKALPLCLYYTAGQYKRFGEAEQAKALYTKVIKQYAGDALVSRNASLQLVGMNICDLIAREDFSAVRAAIRNFKSTYAASPDLRKGLLLIAESCYEDGLRASRQLPDANNVFFRQSIAILEDKLLSDVCDVLMMASINYVRGLDYEMLGEYQQAADSYQKAFEADPKHIYADYCLFAAGRCYEKLVKNGSVTEADAKPVIKAQYDKLLKDYPQSVYSPYASRRLVENE